MSLLIKALRQAEKQNEQAAKRAAKVSIELPPEAERSNPPPAAVATESPLSSALSLAVETQKKNSNDFPTIDQDFASTADDLAQPNEPDEPDRSIKDQPSTLSLETVETLVTDTSTESQPEAFARHAPEVQAPAVPELAMQQTVAAEPKESTPANAEVPGSAPSFPDDPVEEAAPYLEVKTALPKRRLSRTPLAVLIGLPIGAVLLAALTAVAVWWNSEGVNEADFQAAIAPPDEIFAINDQPLSQLDVGNAVGGTGNASPEPAQNLSGPVATGPEQSLVASPELTTSLPAQQSKPISEPEQTVSGPIANAVSNSAGAPAASPPVSNNIATNSEPPAAPPVRRVLSPLLTTRTVPPVAARPAVPAVRFVRSVSSGEQSQQLMNDAYQALQRNELEQAKAGYQQALRIDRNLIDGWVGLASIASRQGNPTLASQHYQRALNIDPNDAVARTGLLALVGSNLPDESESTLRTLLGSDQPNTMAELTLANALARQGRWAEAQQAYFNANASQPNQPDTVFNLAVSLERIRQSRAALTYYEQALVLSESRQALFDPELARQRVSALKQALQEQ